jgi:hypothetical protein
MSLPSHPPRFDYPNNIWNMFNVTNRDSSIGIALGYGLDGWGSRVRFSAGAGNFSLHYRVQNGSGAHPASYPVGTRGSFPGDKAARARSWPLTSIQCRGQECVELYLHVFMVWYLVKQRDNFTLLLHI